jgi:hypothetical protein
MQRSGPGRVALPLTIASIDIAAVRRWRQHRGTPFAIFQPGGGERPVSAQEAPVSTALIRLAATDREAPPAPAALAGARPRADFVAQLIATSWKAPQTRARRRAEPQAAIAAYRALRQSPTPPPPGRALSRSL